MAQPQPLSNQQLQSFKDPINNAGSLGVAKGNIITGAAALDLKTANFLYKLKPLKITQKIRNQK